MLAGTSSLRDLVESLFRPNGSGLPDGSMGAELELIPVRVGSWKRVGIKNGNAGPGSADVARDAARGRGWREDTDANGTPSWTTPDGGRISYEPGGQIEISSPVFQSAARLARFLRETVSALRDSAGDAQISLLALGVDPYNALEDVPFELHAPRYEAMAGYFDLIGTAGARMMRQTASLQVNVELGANVIKRWTLLNALAPYLVAAFANSSTYLGRPTGYASYRARLWQTLDRSRTGLPFSAIDPIGRYAHFASSAGRILDNDKAHLTTLFPEIRPRGYFEIRSMDSMEPDRVAEALRFASCIIHDADIAAEATRVLGAPDPTLLERAAELGRADTIIGKRLAVLEHMVTQSAVAND